MDIIEDFFSNLIVGMFILLGLFILFAISVVLSIYVKWLGDIFIPVILYPLGYFIGKYVRKNRK